MITRPQTRRTDKTGSGGGRPSSLDPFEEPAVLSRTRVLVADDNELIRITLVEAIERTEGLVVVGTAKDADEAIRIASLRHPDAALLDVRMPHGGGPRAAREIRWRSPDTRIIALSALDDDRSIRSMLASGATSYLSKDSPLEEIMEAVVRSTQGGSSLSAAVTEHVVSELGARLAREDRSAEERRDKEDRIRRFIDGTGGLTMAYQPIVELSSGRIVGVEALARFPSWPARTPDIWFDEAAEIGLGTELQVAAVRLAAGDRPPPARCLPECERRSSGCRLTKLRRCHPTMAR
jgi:DNA-binding NarL/FixJ family response regulator